MQRRLSTFPKDPQQIITELREELGIEQLAVNSLRSVFSLLGTWWTGEEERMKCLLSFLPWLCWVGRPETCGENVSIANSQEGVEYCFTAIILQDAACLDWLCFALSLHRQEFQCRPTLSVKYADDGYAGRSCSYTCKEEQHLPSTPPCWRNQKGMSQEKQMRFSFEKCRLSHLRTYKPKIQILSEVYEAAEI